MPEGLGSAFVHTRTFQNVEKNARPEGGTKKLAKKLVEEMTPKRHWNQKRGSSNKGGRGLQGDTETQRKKQEVIKRWLVTRVEVIKTLAKFEGWGIKPQGDYLRSRHNQAEQDLTTQKSDRHTKSGANIRGGCASRQGGAMQRR